ncbi:hypothetical protein GQ55_1G051200 [Panicum hallii var. hallii]|uniref:Uncharacterized protein n=1 Tax=Panicum hallii var. hallii TaxID=1504633 RepID=A0A2T7F2G4_9POAL|nr:hypothetical protein GQ55_1G051200 [Panicum hallii var. hallii]
MAEGSCAAVAPAPCRLGGAVAAPAPGRRCCSIGGGGGCGLGLARLVRRLRRRGRRALRAASSSAQPRRRACQYDPLSYARNFDLGGCDGDGDAARGYYSCSFSSRFVLVPASSSSAGAGAVPVGAAPAAVATS